MKYMKGTPANIRAAIDANGNQVTIAGVAVPCAGNWRQP